MANQVILVPAILKSQAFTIGGSFVLNDLGVFLDESGKKTQIIVLKIPQGDAAYDATKIFIENRFTKIIMTGAGGNLNAIGEVGDYVLIDQAEYHGEHIRLNKDALVCIDSCPYVAPVWTKNITVDTPLDETEDWYDQHKDNGCVDVETFHIFKAISEANNVKVISGMFISDCVKKIPFFDLLSGSRVGKNIADFSVRSLALMSSITIEKQIEDTDIIDQKKQFFREPGYSRGNYYCGNQ